MVQFIMYQRDNNMATPQIPIISHSEALKKEEDFNNAVDQTGRPLNLHKTKDLEGQTIISLRTEDGYLYGNEIYQVLPETTKEKITGVGSDAVDVTQAIGTNLYASSRDLVSGSLGLVPEAFMGLSRIVHEGTGEVGDFVEDYNREQAAASGDFSQYLTPKEIEENEKRREEERKALRDKYMSADRYGMGFKSASDFIEPVFPKVERDVSTPFRRLTANVADELSFLAPYIGFLAKQKKFAGLAASKKELLNSPARFTATESAIAAGGGTALTLADNYFKNPNNVQLSNLAGSMVTSGIITGFTKRKYKTSVATEEGRENIASQIIKENTYDVDAALRGLDEENILDADYLSGSRSGDAGLRLHESALVNKGDEVPTRWVLFQREFNKKIKKKISEILGDGSVPDNGDSLYIKKEVNKIRKDIETKIIEAEDSITQSFADDLIHTSDQAANQSKEKIIKIRDDLRVKRNQAFDEVPNEPVGVDILEKEIKNFELAHVKKVGINPRKQFVNAHKTLLEDLKKLKEKPTIENIRHLQERIGIDIDIAYAKGDNRLGTRLGDIKRSIDSQIEEASKYGHKKLKKAVALSHIEHEYFGEGTIGKILSGTDRQTGTPSRETLDGLFGTNGGTAADELLRMIDNPNSQIYNPSRTVGANTEIASGLLKDIDNHILGKLAKEVNDSTSKKKHQIVQNFLNKNQAMLERFPSAKVRIQKIADDIFEAENTVKILENHRTKLNKTVAAKFLDFTGNFDDNIEKIFNSNNSAEFESLIKRAKKDTTGDTIKAIRASLHNIIIENRLKDLDSGQEFHRILKNKKRQLIQVYGEDGFKLLEEVDKAHKIFWSGEKTVRGSKTAPTIYKGEKTATTILARMIAARLGALSPFVGGTLQAPAYAAGRAGEFVENLGADQINKIIEEAFYNPELMKKLLRKPTAKNLTDYQKQLKKSPFLRTALNLDIIPLPEKIELKDRNTGNVPDLPLDEDEKPKTTEFILRDGMYVPIERLQGTQTTN